LTEKERHLRKKKGGYTTRKRHADEADICRIGILAEKNQELVGVLKS
jgi:hypothetical protein